MPDTDNSMPLGKQLVADGLIQFGHFASADVNHQPILFSLHLLPAYPDLLQKSIQRVAEAVRKFEIERIVCTADSIPLGVGTALATGIPLVYSRGQGASPVYDMVGAYDVGHPSVMLTNTNIRSLHAQIADAALRVGLNVIQTVALVGVTPGGTEDVTIIDLDELIVELVSENQITSAMQQSIMDWLDV